MIQRIQSVFLLLAGVAYMATALFRTVYINEGQEWIMPTVLGLNGLVALGALVAIFLYNDRKKQLQVLNMLKYLALVVIVAAFGALFMLGALAEAASNTGVMAMIGLPVLGYILIHLAAGKVKKDIALVRSMDRLR